VTVKIHLNWSGCRDWLAARNKIRPLARGATLHGNFADIEGDAATAAILRRELIRAGFTVWVRLSPYGFDLYGVN
jgi:hypothetical protein